MNPISVEDSQPTTYLDDIPISGVPASNNIPQDAIILSKYYSTTIIRSLTPFQHTKTPWHVLFLSHAKNCLASLALEERIDCAMLCAFYAILAASAFSLGSVSQAQKWLDQAQSHKQQAREHAREMLRTAYNVPKTVKYKSVLIALIGMVQVSFLTGDGDTTECYLLQTENFIRLRGLSRRKPRKVRVLHHCYVYTRMIHESTFVHLCAIRISSREAVSFRYSS